MRHITFLLLLISLHLNAKEIELKTTIKEVTVFQSGAQVNRTGSIKIPAGESEIILTEPTSLLKKESIQVKGEGNFTILSVNYQEKKVDVDNEKLKWNELETKQKSLMQQMEDLSVKIQILNSQETTIMNLKNISTSTKGVTVEQISKAQDVVHLKLMEIKTEKLKYSRSILDLFDQHKTVSQHLIALKTPKQNIRFEIIIKVSAKTAVNGDFIVSYIIPNARWYPTYDLRVKSITEPMVIEYKANVTQESGEDWNNIKLTLSTGDPSQSSQKPELNVWQLYLNQSYVQPNLQNKFYRYTNIRFNSIEGVIINEETGEPIPWCNVLVNNSTIGTTSDENGNFSLMLPIDADQIQVNSIGYESEFITLSEKNTIVKLKKQNLHLKNTVKTDYSGNLMSVNSPVFNTDYVDKLSLLDVSVDYRHDSINGTYFSKDGYSKTYSYSEITASKKSEESMSIKKIYNLPAKNVTSTKTLNIVSTEFSINEKYTILSDPKFITVSIQKIQSDVKYQYYCAPRLDKEVFLTAQLIDWEQYNLLEGQANVFFEGTFIGSTVFDTKYLVDTLEISLGRDKGIKVERKKSKDYNKHQVIGNDNITFREWDIVVRNSKQQAIDILIEDQFPVSVDNKVDVIQEEKSGGILNEKTGVVTWSLKMEASTSNNLQLKYKVKYPKGSYVGLD